MVLAISYNVLGGIVFFKSNIRPQYNFFNISSVPEGKLMGVELIGVNKFGLINWSQLIGVN